MNWGTPAEFPAIYEELNVPAFFAGFAREALDRAQLRPGARLLDVATGTGIVLRLAREREPGLARVTGLDLMGGMLAVARERADAAGLDIELVEGDALDLPFEDESFDAATCQQGVQFFPDRVQALRELRRVLVPGGRAVVACWAEMAASPAHEAIADVVAKLVPEAEAAARNPYSLASADALASLLREAGFADVEVERVEGDLRFPSAEELTRGYLEGSPMALALAHVGAEEREALFRAIVDEVRARIGEPIVSSMVTNISTGIAPQA
jgi:ubiquinone/menaquinone biosynthesis C-methylase UbiE